MTDLQRSRRHRGNTQHLAACNRDEKQRNRKANRRAARRDPNAVDGRLDNRNIS